MLRVSGRRDTVESILRLNPPPRTGHAMFALGNVQIGKGRFDEAYKTHAQVLTLFKSSLGIRHHRTADTCHKLGWHLNRMRNYPAAMYDP